MNGPRHIWLVWATRGDYDERIEYAVCWLESHNEAVARAQTMFAVSNKFRERLGPLSYNYELLDEARDAIGDPNWTPSDQTYYHTMLLEHG